MKHVTLLVILCAGFAGCASGPSYKTYTTALTPPPKGDARVWFYRPSKLFGTMTQPEVFINDTAIGKCQPGCFFYVDRKPGDYTVQCTTESAEKTQLTLKENQVQYIRLTVLPGATFLHVAPKPVTETDALKEIQSCKLITAGGINVNWKPPEKRIATEVKQ